MDISQNTCNLDKRKMTRRGIKNQKHFFLLPLPPSFLSLSPFFLSLPPPQPTHSKCLHGFIFLRILVDIAHLMQVKNIKSATLTSVYSSYPVSSSTAPYCLSLVRYRNCPLSLYLRNVCGTHDEQGSVPDPVGQGWRKMGENTVPGIRELIT